MGTSSLVRIIHKFSNLNLNNSLAGIYVVVQTFLDTQNLLDKADIW